MPRYDPLPYYEEPLESPVSAPEIAAEFPLILINRERFLPQFQSEHRQFGMGTREPDLRVSPLWPNKHLINSTAY